MTGNDYPYAVRPDAVVRPPESPSTVWRWHRPTSTPAVMEEDGQSSLATFAIVVIAAVLIASVGNALLFPVVRLMRPGPLLTPSLGLGMALVGSMGAQTALLAVLTVWGPGPLWMRWIWITGLAATAFSAWYAGFAASFADMFGRGRFPVAEVFASLAGLPLLILVCQSGLWFAKIYLGWQIEGETDAPLPEPRDQGTPNIASPEQERTPPLAIRDMILGTLIVAVCLSAVRMSRPASLTDLGYWQLCAIIGGIAAVASLLILAIVYLTLAPRHVWLVVVLLAVLAAVLASLATVLVIATSPPGMSDPLVATMMGSLVAGFFLVLAGTLGVSRGMGYRLVTSRPVRQ
jgi:MFS family permease